MSRIARRSKDQRPLHLGMMRTRWRLIPSTMTITLRLKAWTAPSHGNASLGRESTTLSVSSACARVVAKCSISSNGRGGLPNSTHGSRLGTWRICSLSWTISSCRYELRGLDRVEKVACMPPFCAKGQHGAVDVFATRAPGSCRRVLWREKGAGKLECNMNFACCVRWLSPVE